MYSRHDIHNHNHNRVWLLCRMLLRFSMLSRGYVALTIGSLTVCCSQIVTELLRRDKTRSDSCCFRHSPVISSRKHSIDACIEALFVYHTYQRGKLNRDEHVLKFFSVNFNLCFEFNFIKCLSISINVYWYKLYPERKCKI